jgi:glutaredoxin
MRTIFIILVILNLVVTARADAPLFNSLSAPLYEAHSRFANLSKLPSLTVMIEDYDKETKHAKKLSESLSSKDEKQAYLKALRHLQQSHDEIIDAVKTQLLRAIQAQEHDTFLTIINSEISQIYKQPSLNETILTYYTKNRDRGASNYLDHRIALDRSYEKVYNTSSHPSSARKQLIMLYTSWCPACKNAKRQLAEAGIRYEGYDVEKTSRGKRLYTEHHGHGVPMFIIDGQAMTGLSLSWIQQRLK